MHIIGGLKTDGRADRHGRPGRGAVGEPKEIRKALETGTYPLIPTEIADALIASGLYGKVGK